MREEAREAFPSVIVPRDFDRIELPFPERGEPGHVRAASPRHGVAGEGAASFAEFL